jgi:hypothetical protein
VNQRLKVLGRAVGPSHVLAILDEQEKDSEVPDSVFAASFQGRAPPTPALT